MEFNKADDKNLEEGKFQEKGIKDVPPVAAGSATGQSAAVLNQMTASIKQVDKNIILRLLKNPFESMALNPSKDLVYGVIGIAAAIIGFLIWALLIGGKLESIFYGMLGFGGLASFGDKGSIATALFGKMFLVAIISNIALLAAIWGIGQWKGDQKQSLKALVTHIGAIHYIAGAGFIIAGILALMSLKLSLLVLLISLLSALMLSIHAAIDLFKVEQNRQALYMILSVSAYLLITGLLAGIVL
ncbi:MAG: hypothetical protein ACE3L7_02730 [Candidatus Pristimantibacillus sp.]